MCNVCAKLVHDMDIMDTDLSYLPFKVVRWHCIVPGCKHYAKVRDYGISPFYYWPVKVTKNRGGWLENTHYYMCSTHWKCIKARMMDIPPRSYDICISRFV